MGPTPERAIHAGDPLVMHRSTNELRRDPKGSMEKLDAGGLRVAHDTLELLFKKGRLSPRDPDENVAMYEAGRRFERLIETAGLAGAIASPVMGSVSAMAPGSKPYVGSERVLIARNALTKIRSQMVRRDYQALEWIVVTGFTVEQGGQMVGGGKPGQAVVMDRLKAALDWLVDHWGTMHRRRH